MSASTFPDDVSVSCALDKRDSATSFVAEITNGPDLVGLTLAGKRRGGIVVCLTPADARKLAVAMLHYADETDPGEHPLVFFPDCKRPCCTAPEPPQLATV